MSRSITKEVFIDALPDVVWQALTQAEQLSRWFPVHATVDGGLGGSISLSWGPGSESTAPITCWEPGRRFGWTEARGLVVEFHLEPQREGTVVRLVQSGFGDGPDWDAEYHMTEGGWAYFVEHLRWYLEQHPDIPRDLIAFRDPIAMPGAEVFDRLTRALGVGGVAVGPAPSDRGTPFDVKCADGQRLSGHVISLARETGQMGLTLNDVGRAILFLEMEPAKEGCRAGFWLSTYRLPPATLEAVRARFSHLYKQALSSA